MDSILKDELKTFWEQLAFSYTGEKGLIKRCWDELCAYYSGPDRCYHDLQHVWSLINSVEKNEQHILNPQALFFAAFYHDIIYDITRSDNEKQSAGLAEKRLAELQVDKQTASLSAEIIRHTAGHKKTGNFDIDLFLDFDRCIFSADEEDYQHYASCIRKEYGIFSDKIYTTARARMIAQFLAEPEIYYTALMKGREQAARRNLHQELEQLQRMAG